MEGSSALARGGLIDDGFKEQVGHVIGGVVIKAKNRRKVGLRGAHEFEAIFLGAGEGLLVGVDGGFAAELLEADAAEKSAALIGGAGVRTGVEYVCW